MADLYLGKNTDYISYYILDHELGATLLILGWAIQLPCPLHTSCIDIRPLNAICSYYLGQEPSIIVIDPELIKQITVKEFNSFMDHVVSD